MRSHTWTGGEPVAAAFEVAMHEADLAADDRYEHAEDLTSVAQLRSRIDEVVSSQQRAIEARDLDLNPKALVHLKVGERSGPTLFWTPGARRRWRPGERTIKRLVSALNDCRGGKVSLIRGKDPFLSTSRL